MAGVSTPELAAAASDAGALGSIGVGATDAAGARAMIEAVRARTERPFNVNLFVHAPVLKAAERETAWLGALAPVFRSFGAEPPAALRAIYKSFVEDGEMLAILIDLTPPVVSFHFGVPSASPTVVSRPGSSPCTDLLRHRTTRVEIGLPACDKVTATCPVLCRACPATHA